MSKQENPAILHIKGCVLKLSNYNPTLTLLHGRQKIIYKEGKA